MCCFMVYLYLLCLYYFIPSVWMLWRLIKFENVIFFWWIVCVSIYDNVATSNKSSSATCFVFFNLVLVAIIVINDD